MSISELEAKQRECDELRATLDDFMESSKDLESELEDALKESNSKVEVLIKGKAQLEEKVASLNTMLSNSVSEQEKTRTTLQKSQGKLETLEVQKRQMEQENDELREKVRILEYSLEESKENVLQLEEDKIILQGEFEDSGEVDRLKRELTEIQSELASMDSERISHQERLRTFCAGLSTSPLSDLPPPRPDLSSSELISLLEKDVSSLLSRTSLDRLSLSLDQQAGPPAPPMRSSDSSPDDEVKKMLQLISEYELREEDLNKEIENLTDEVMSQAILVQEARLLNDALTEEKARLEHLLSAKEAEADEHAERQMDTSLQNSTLNNISEAEERISKMELIIQSLNSTVSSLQVELGESQRVLHEEREDREKTRLAWSEEISALRELCESKERKIERHVDGEKCDDDFDFPTNGPDVSQLLQSSFRVEEDILSAMRSNNMQRMKDELSTQLTRHEKMRANNAKLLHKLQTVSNHIQVCCRVRPPSDQELGQGASICIDILDDGEMACFDKRSGLWRSFAFDKVWDDRATQADVFADIEPLALSVTDGFNACILAYGQTGSGKTYTMNGWGKEFGVSYRTLHKIFELLNLKQQHAAEIDERVRSGRKSGKGYSVDGYSMVDREQEEPNGETPNKEMSGNWSFSFSVKVAMLEIYNETIKDLLSLPDNSSRMGSSPPPTASGTGLDIRHDSDGRVSVPSLTKISVNNLEDVMQVFAKGSSNRATSATYMNEHSSRSHAILIVEVTTCVKDGVPITAKLHLVDLAGSERMGRNVSDISLKETQHINKSLSALGDVMEALDSKAKHVPYRNSKLTYLLQDSLGGNSKTMMIVTVCPSEITMEESLFTLQFATRARNIQLTSVKKNMSWKTLEESLKSLRLELKEQQKKRQASEELVGELRREQKKFQEKLSNHMDTRNRAMQDNKKTSDQQIDLLSKINSDLNAHIREEKESHKHTQAEFHKAQKFILKLQDSISSANRERERIMALMATKEREIETLRSHLNYMKSSSASVNYGDMHAHAVTAQTLTPALKQRNTLAAYPPTKQNHVSVNAIGTAGVKPSRLLASSATQSTSGRRVSTGSLSHSDRQSLAYHRDTSAVSELTLSEIPEVNSEEEDHAEHTDYYRNPNLDDDEAVDEDTNSELAVVNSITTEDTPSFGEGPPSYFAANGHTKPKSSRAPPAYSDRPDGPTTTNDRKRQSTDGQADPVKAFKKGTMAAMANSRAQDAMLRHHERMKARREEATKSMKTVAESGGWKS